METKDLVQNALTATREVKLSKAIPMISKSPVRAVVIQSGKSSIDGIIDGRSLLDFHENAENTNCGTMASRVPIISENTTPEELVTHFLNTNARALPFVSDGMLEGAVSRSNALRLIEDSSAVRKAKVSDFMSHKGALVDENMPVQNVRRKMREIGAFHLAVVNKKGEVSGVVSALDIVQQVVPYQRTGFKDGTYAPTPEVGAEMEHVKAIMHSSPATTTPQAPLSSAVAQMIAKNITCLIVVDGPRPVGLLSAKDAMHAVLKPTQEPVMVYGLREDEKALAESIRGLGADFLAKLDKRLPADYLAIHVKSFQEGKKRRYAIKGKLCIRGRLLTATNPESSQHKSVWDLHLSVKEVLGELLKISAVHGIDKARSMKRRRDEDKQEQ